MAGDGYAERKWAMSAHWAGQVMILAWAIAAGVLTRRYR
jgi:hypothetical protein